MKGVIIAIVVLALAGAGYYFFILTPTTQAPTGEQMMPKTETVIESGESVMEQKTDGGMKESGAAMMSGEVKVTLKNFAFGPNEVRVKAGDKVTWTNEDIAGHTVTADGGSFGSKVLSQGKSFSHTFTEKGTFTYHCEPHPNMKGKVIVE